MTIDRLIKKYNGYVPGELRSREYEQKKKQKQRTRERHERVEEIGELMFLRTYELDTIHYLVDKFPNFRKLHGKASNDTVLTALCFILIRIRKPSARLYEYKACAMYGLTPEIFITIQNKIIGELLASAPIVPRDATGKYDHSILYKGSRRQAERVIFE